MGDPVPPFRELLTSQFLSSKTSHSHGLSPRGHHPPMYGPSSSSMLVYTARELSGGQRSESRKRIIGQNEFDERITPRDLALRYHSPGLVLCHKHPTLACPCCGVLLCCPTPTQSLHNDASSQTAYSLATTHRLLLLLHSLCLSLRTALHRSCSRPLQARA